MLCVCLHCIGDKRIHICTYPTVICLSFTRVGPLVSCKSFVFPFHLDVIARLLNLFFLFHSDFPSQEENVAEPLLIFERLFEMVNFQRKQSSG